MRSKILLIAALFAFTFSACDKDENLDSNLTQETRDLKECETAFAYDKESCFLDFTDYNFNRWGWVIGPLTAPHTETYDLYAGAGKCILTNGTLVGTVSVNYMDDYVEVEFETSNEWVMTETHLYVGNEMFPQKPNGQYTVAPGQYGNSSSSSSGTHYEGYKIDDVSGELYIIAHAVVCPKKKFY